MLNLMLYNMCATETDRNDNFFFFLADNLKPNCYIK